MDYYKNVSYMISHIFLAIFFYLFVAHRYTKRKTAVLCFLSFLILCILDCFKLNFFPDSSLCYIIVTIVQILVTQSSGMLISRQRNGKVLFIGLSASNYVIAGSIIACVLHIYTGSIPLSLAGSVAVHVLLLIFLYRRLRDICFKYYENERLKSPWKLCLIPVFFYCGFSFLAFFPHTLYEYPNNIPGILVFILTMFVSYVIVVQYVESESIRNDMYWQNALSESYIKGLENQYALVEQSQKRLQILRHDMRHYAEMINTLLNQGETAEIRKIVSHISDVSDESRVATYCDNLVINTILANTAEKARSFEIELKLKLRIEKELPINCYEFAAVLANLFENAFLCIKDYDKQSRYVDAKIHCTKEYLLIHMKNRCDREVLFDSVTGLPKSKNGKNHGLGMQSVQSFSNRIGGTIGCYYENGFFIILLHAKF